MNLAYALNTAWMWKCSGELRRFLGATRDVEATQSALLAEIVRSNQATDFGSLHGFKSVRSFVDFQKRVPLTTYDSYAESIHRIASGEPNVLTHQRVRLFEPTSGTTSGQKLIPYTASLAEQFQRAIAAWISDLMQNRPAVRRGRAYWSISPAFGSAQETPAGIPIGFEDDTAYLGRVEQFAARHLLVAPQEIARMKDLDNFRYTTLLHLINSKDLALISVWSPTFLSTLFRSFEEWSDQLCHDLEKGSLSFPNSEAGETVQSLRPRANPRRAEEVRAILCGSSIMEERTKQLWPRLSLISCWTEGSAASYLHEMRSLFSSVEVQPKGLLATEAAVSIPLVGRSGSALAVRSHFFEFLKVDRQNFRPSNSDKYLLAHELSLGEVYSVVVTTGGGLYRYQLHDVIEVVGFECECPLVQFVGKSNCVNDLVGEKLNEVHVREVLTRLFSTNELSPDFALIVPIPERPPRYRLYIQGKKLSDLSQVEINSLANAIQAGLEENPYYQHAVRLGQLSSLEVCVLNSNGKPGWQVYEQGCVARGQKSGDIKATVLVCQTDWADDFSQIT